MKKYLLYALVAILVYFLWKPVLGIFFPEYNYSIIYGSETIQAISEYLKENYKAEDFGINTNGEAWEWKIFVIREKDPLWGDFVSIFKKRHDPPRRNRTLMVKVKHRKAGSGTWRDAAVARKKLLLNVDETDLNRVIVKEAE